MGSSRTQTQGGNTRAVSSEETLRRVGRRRAAALNLMSQSSEIFIMTEIPLNALNGCNVSSRRTMDRAAGLWSSLSISFVRQISMV